MNQLSFTPCPTTKHKGELWKKLDPVDPSADLFILTDIKFSWSDYVPLEWLQADTFPDYTLEDWRELMKIFYRLENVFGMQLTFESQDNEMELTTFRAYKPQTHFWYGSKLNKKDELWQIRIKEPEQKQPEPEPPKMHSLEEF